MKRTILCALAAAAVLFGAGNSLATGFGGQIGFGGGAGTFEYDFPGAEEMDVDASSFGIGFLMETAPLSTELFSYRLGVGLEGLNLEDDENVTAELGGLTIDNTFAFRLAGDSTWRLWVGPQVRLAFYGGETDKKVLGDKIEFSASAFGLGPAFGGNWSVSDNLILGFDTGIRWTGYSGTAEWGSYSEDVTGSTSIFFINFDMLYDAK